MCEIMLTVIIGGSMVSASYPAQRGNNENAKLTT